MDEMAPHGRIEGRKGKGTDIMTQRVFITGVTGYLGSAIATRLVRSGYEVHGLTRNAERAPDLTARGIHPVVGSIAKPDTFLHALKNCDAAIHAAFDASDVANQDRLALEAFRIGALDGRVRRLLYTSGAWVHGDTGGRVIDESAPLNPIDLVRWRAAHEDVAIDMAEHDVKAVVLRPAIVYGGSRGIIGSMFAEAHEHRNVHYPGSGTQHWGLIHRDDVAEAYLRALERAEGGERYLLADGSEFTVRQIADAIAGVTGTQPRAHEASDVLKQLGLFGRALLTDQKINAAKARHDLGWTPRHTSFVDEVAKLDQEWLATRGTPVA
jgi:nucleoside-diphosphate-sugar epimerase